MRNGTSRVIIRAAVLLVVCGSALVLGPGSARPAVRAARGAQRQTFNPVAHLTASGEPEPVCESFKSLCRDAFKTAGDPYVGHDEPSVAFRSSEPGSANDITYTVRLPQDPPKRPKADGSGGVWNFELRPTFWLGLTLCDTESAPEFTQTCTPDSDTNNLVGTDPNAPDYIGKHPGNAFMELQFYGPGYVPQFEGFGCDARHYCAAMTIDSLTEDQNTHTFNTADCDNYILGGQEPVNWAYITKSGHSQAPADPLFTGTFDNPNFAAVNPDYPQDLLMNPGDRIRIHLHDTAAGYRADLTDLDTHRSGSMTASIANGFAHVLFTPGDQNACQSAPYAFHAEYSTANARGNTWSAHTTNVSYSDEIGHFEHCLELDANFNCAVAGSDDEDGLDADDVFCVPGSDSTLIHINGCFQADLDFDGPSYQPDWPGTNPNVHQDRKFHMEPVIFSSPTTNGGHQYPNFQFEADMPAFEPTCDTTTGAGCTNPPPGAEFYPFYSPRLDRVHGNGRHHETVCNWQEGGDFIPGTVNDYGGSSAEFGSLLLTTYPGAGFTPVQRYENFNSGTMPNTCPAGG
jgi:hypothetical protein